MYAKSLGRNDRVLNYEAVFFFFQAEDGIRDVAVTGVQTCALPISPRNPSIQHAGLRPRRSFSLGRYRMRSHSAKQQEEQKVDHRKKKERHQPERSPEIGRASCRERV